MDLLLWGHDQGVEAAELATAGRARGRRGRGRLQRDRAPARRHRVPARARGPRRPRTADMCGIAGIVRPQRRARRPTSRRCCEWRGAIRHRGPGRLRLRARPGRRPGQRPGSRSSICPAAGSRSRTDRAAAIIVYNGEVYNHYELRRRARARRARRFETTSDTEVVLRLLEREGLAAARPLQRPVRARLVAAGPAAADPDPRPLRGAPASLRAARRRHASSSAPRRRRSSPPARSSRRPTCAGIDDVFTLWGAARRRGPPFAASTSSRPGGLLVWERGPDRRGADAGGAPPSTSTARPTATSRSCCATACGCGSAPTCRSAPTSPAGSTRA